MFRRYVLGCNADHSVGMTDETRQIALFSSFFFNPSGFIQLCLFYAEGVLHATNSQIFSSTAAERGKKNDFSHSEQGKATEAKPDLWIQQRIQTEQSIDAAWHMNCKTTACFVAWWLSCVTHSIHARLPLRHQSYLRKYACVHVCACVCACVFAPAFFQISHRSELKMGPRHAIVHRPATASPPAEILQSSIRRRHGRGGIYQEDS